MRTKALVYGAIAIALTACSSSVASSNPTLTPSSSPSPTISPSDSPIVRTQLKTISVVVAAKDIPSSTQLTADMITIAVFSPDQAPPYAFHARDLVVGTYTVIPLHADQAITDNVLSLVRVVCTTAK
jgi:Flp pilus assembly protein CpaB